MDIKEFIGECNQSPLFKGYTPITVGNLKQAGFFRDEYSLTDLLSFKERLSDAGLEIVYPDYKGFKPNKKWESRHMLHKEKMLLENNKKLIKRLRQKLEIPFPDRGLMLDPKNSCEKNFVNIVLENQSQEYKEWIYHIIGKKSSDHLSMRQRFVLAEKVNKRVFDVVEILLKKWSLSSRYHDAIIELVLFNRIIPADENISFGRRYDIHSNGTSQMSIRFDTDTTKEELIQFITQDAFGLFTGKNKVVKARLKRRSKNESATRKMKKVYNQIKKNGSTDAIALAAVRRDKDFRHLTLSAIRKRIKN
jgi:hypothetical protein